MNVRLTVGVLLLPWAAGIFSGASVTVLCPTRALSTWSTRTTGTKTLYHVEEPLQNWIYGRVVMASLIPRVIPYAPSKGEALRP